MNNLIKILLAVIGLNTVNSADIFTVTCSMLSSRQVELTIKQGVTYGKILPQIKSAFELDSIKLLRGNVPVNLEDPVEPDDLTVVVLNPVYIYLCSNINGTLLVRTSLVEHEHRIIKTYEITQPDLLEALMNLDVDNSKLIYFLPLKGLMGRLTEEDFKRILEEEINKINRLTGEEIRELAFRLSYDIPHLSSLSLLRLSEELNKVISGKVKQ